MARPEPSDQAAARLLDVLAGLSGDLHLRHVLERIVAAACALVDARYGALGVIGPDRLLVEFVHQGVDDDTVAAIGHLPEGHGILGLLIEHPRPLRLRDLTMHQRARGFPAHHPAMQSFLGLPIYVREEVFGNLYLCEKRSGSAFSEADESLVAALAISAGSAIATAQLFEEARRRERSLYALQRIATAVLAGTERDDVLSLIAFHAKEVHSADTAAVALLAPPGGELHIAAAVGEGAAEMLSMAIPSTHSVCGEVLRTGQPVRLDDGAGDPRVCHAAVEATGAGPLLFVPLWSHGHAIGTLAVACRKGAIPFDRGDVALLQSYASRASVALEHAPAQPEPCLVAVRNEQERIARDLHDSAIKRLFRIGMSLQSTATLLVDKPFRDRIEHAIDDVDAAIREIRSTIFALDVESMHR